MPDRTRKPAQPSAAPLIVGLCGGVGSGKSTVAGLLGGYGARVLDADAQAQAALEQDDMKAALVKQLGHDILDPQGRVNRSDLARRVFSSEGAALREWLEDLLHPRIRDQLNDALGEARNAASPPWCVVLDVPLLIEGPVRDWCDRIVFVETSEEDRRTRTVADRGWTADEYTRRETAQASLQDKRAHADHVVSNKGTMGDLKSAVEQLVQLLRPPDRMGSESPESPRPGAS
ncbi:MAG: dephospho-CoA kinase [Planctomycetota bacterium]|nr:dephospho-CoA kinase [Planctomycetota bacterium]